MKISPGQIIQSRFPLALAAGLLLAAAFPKIGVAGFAWIAPGLMLTAALGRDGAEGFRLGYVAGLAHYLTSLYWLLLIPYRWRGIPLGPAFGWLALSAYLALFPAMWVWLALKISNFKFQISNPPRPDWPSAFEQISALAWSRRMLWTFYCAASWVALEMILVRLLGGFPWNLLGTSQYRMGPLIQLASVTGVYGVSFLVVWTSVSLLGAAAVMVRRPGVRSVWLGEMIFPMLTVAATFAWGFHKIAHTPPAAREVKVTLIQPSIPQTLIWNPDNDTERFQALLRLSEAALTNETDLLVWPEAAIPKMLRYHEEIFRGVTQLARAHHVWMIVGSDDAEPRAGVKNRDDASYFNSAFLISPSGELVDRYCKRNLVIFGEYIPLVRWLPFLKWFTPIDGGFTPGTNAVQFALELATEHRPPTRPGTNSVDQLAGPEAGAPSETRRIKVAPLICYEDTFPQLGREAANDDTDFLVNLTNDGWFGEGAAQWQQAAGATFRAVENGRPLVRCANTGLTCWMDEAGGLREIFADNSGSVYGAGFITLKIPLVENRTPTFYHQHGDWFGWGCVALTALAVVRSLFTRPTAR